jgi:hypothetical protein
MQRTPNSALGSLESSNDYERCQCRPVCKAKVDFTESLEALYALSLPRLPGCTLLELARITPPEASHLNLLQIRQQKVHC